MDIGIRKRKAPEELAPELHPQVPSKRETL
jgi:hypothetical protein